MQRIVFVLWSYMSEYNVLIFRGKKYANGKCILKNAIETTVNASDKSEAIAALHLHRSTYALA